MNNKKHYRKSYENLYKRLCWEVDIVPIDVSSFSDYQLLKELNTLLIKWNCTPLTEEELEMDLI